MTHTSMLADIAESLDNAERLRTAVSPLTESNPGLSVEDAYAIQAAWLDRQLARRANASQRLVGRKVGLTNAAMQRQLGVNEPDFGFLLQSMLVRSGATIDSAELIQPRVEPEIAFWLERPLRGPGVSRADVLAATRSGQQTTWTSPSRQCGCCAMTQRLAAALERMCSVTPPKPWRG